MNNPKVHGSIKKFSVKIIVTLLIIRILLMWITMMIFQRLIQANNYLFLKVEIQKINILIYTDVVQPPVFGPSIVFGGQSAKWTGNSNENLGIVALESRLNFETKAGKRVLATFEIVNTGTTTIYYDWKVSLFSLT